ncbi:hypothetical protein DFH27DRAFT_520499 [Peziza echinospora]|nr:hypothetical protein DFH27DRAFT_520499 [Peziza echinospora]
MEGIDRHRGASSALGHSQRPAKRVRTSHSTMSHDSRTSNAGHSASTPSRDRHASSGPSSSNNHGTILVPATILLPNQDVEGRRTVIDLTEDSPPPPSRASREIIDVDALPDRPSSFFGDSTPQMYFARQRHPRPMGSLGNGPARPVEPNPLYNQNPFAPNYQRYHHHHHHHHHQDISNPILGNGGRMVPGIGSGLGLRHGGTMSSGGSTIPAAANEERDVGGGGGAGGFGTFLSTWGWFPSGAANVASQLNWHVRGPLMDVHFQAPVLNYRLGPNGHANTPPAEDAARQREAEYKLPPPAKEGFTRTPQKDDILVCPGCDYELGTDNGDEVQGTVWLGKCGHCYCGKCAAEIRNSRRHARGAAPTGAHSGSCTVCKTKLRGAKALWEVFL